MWGLSIAKFGFGVESEGVKHRSGLGRRKASFLTLWEETLQTCPKPSPASLDDKTFNSLTAKSVPAETNNSRLEVFLLAKHLKHTAQKHHHHDRAVFPSSGMVLLDEHTPPPGTSSEWVGQGPFQMV